jgi:hypothetical protein
MTDAIDHEVPLPPSDAPQRRKGGFGLLFWVVFLFGVLCVLAGAAIALYAPVFLPGGDKAAPAKASVTGAAPLPAGPVATVAPPAPLAAAEPPPTAGSVEVNALAERIDRIEDDQARLSRAASAALAASALSEAADGPRPFADELSALAPLLPSSADLQALSANARQGAPTLSSLAQAWPDVAARAALAARARTQGEGLLDRMAQAIASVLTIRRVDRLEGSDADAVLARATRAIDDGDLEAALREIDALPPAARDAVANWRARALRRLEIDRRVGAIRTAALAELARSAAEAPPS